MSWRSKLKYANRLKLLQVGISIFMLCGVIQLSACHPKTSINNEEWYYRFANAIPNAGGNSLDSVVVAAVIKYANIDALLDAYSTPFKCDYKISIVAFDSQYCYLQYSKEYPIPPDTSKYVDSTAHVYNFLWIYDRHTGEWQASIKYPEH